MKQTFLLLAALLLSACQENQSIAPPPRDWELAPTTHICTPEQSARVQADTTFCNKETTFRSAYCYGAAIMRNCTKGSGK